MFPGQGAQKKGMGADLFEKYPVLVKKADEILGYSIEELCLHDRERVLNNTQFTQPALYVVNAMHYYEKKQEGIAGDYVMGHSMGEYNALLAADVFDFETGLRLVKKRGALMAAAKAGAMAAVIGLNIFQVLNVIIRYKLEDIVVANYNTTDQIVISGKRSLIIEAEKYFKIEGASIYLVLKSSGAFHSPLMQEAGELFSEFLEQHIFNTPKIPIVTNYDTQLYMKENIKELLVKQITNNVRWAESMQYLLDRYSNAEFIEIGNNRILLNMLKKIKKSRVIALPFIENRGVVKKVL